MVRQPGSMWQALVDLGWPTGKVKEDRETLEARELSTDTDLLVSLGAS